jgi:hypothetical protein
MNKIVSIIALAAFSLSGASAVFAQSYSSGTCVSLSRTMSYGSRGSDVTQLQRFLVSQNYPGGGSWMITGTFGPATQTAVRNFQQQNGLSISGSVDSATRNAVNQVSCYGSSSYNYSNASSQSYLPYQYSNTSYAAPSYAYTNPSYQYQYPTYTPTQTYGNSTNSYYPYQNCSTYNSGYNSGYMYGNSYNCGNQNNQNNSYSQLSIYSVSPNSGAIGSTVTVYGNGFTSTGNTVRIGAFVVNNLTSIDGRSLSFTIPTVPQAYAYYGYNSQQYALGTYGLTVTNSSGYTSNSISFTITGYGQTASPTITSVNGPATIGVGQVGTWTVVINNPSSNYATVSVNWGDVSTYAQASQQQSYSQGVQTITFTHAYNVQGAFTPTFTVTNGNGPAANSSLSVTVTGSGSYGSNPTISSINPVYASVGTNMTIYGTNFTGANTIMFNSGALNNVYTTSGNTLSFVLPSAVGAYCPQGQACPTYAQLLTPGTYNVSVINQNGTSNPVTLVIQ